MKSLIDNKSWWLIASARLTISIKTSLPINHIEKKDNWYAIEHLFQLTSQWWVEGHFTSFESGWISVTMTFYIITWFCHKMINSISWHLKTHDQDNDLPGKLFWYFQQCLLAALCLTKQRFTAIWMVVAVTVYCTLGESCFAKTQLGPSFTHQHGSHLPT